MIIASQIFVFLIKKFVGDCENVLSLPSEKHQLHIKSFRGDNKKTVKGINYHRNSFSIALLFRNVHVKVYLLNGTFHSSFSCEEKEHEQNRTSCIPIKISNHYDRALDELGKSCSGNSTVTAVCGKSVFERIFFYRTSSEQILNGFSKLMISLLTTRFVNWNYLHHWIKV